MMMHGSYSNTLNRLNGGLTPAVRGLLVANIAIYLLEWLMPDWFMTVFGLTAAGIRHGFVWQFVTYMFLHSTNQLFHIILNMLVLFMIGPETERGLGSKHFLTVYFLSGIFGGVMWVLLGYASPCIGASGAIYGMLGAFAALWPRREITLLIFFILPITIRAWLLACGLAVIEFVASVFGAVFPDGISTVAHLVHLVGLVVGVAYVFFILHRKGLFAFRRPAFRVMDGGLRRDGRNPGAGAVVNVDPVVVDQLLDKIANHGMHSLTARERAILEAASRRK